MNIRMPARCAKKTHLPPAEHQDDAALAAQLAEEDGDDVGGGVCDVCQERGLLLVCDNCDCTRHMQCCNPPLDVEPEGPWFCSDDCRQIYEIRNEVFNAAGGGGGPGVGPGGPGGPGD